MEIKELDKDLIYRANYNSFGGTRGDSSQAAYNSYVKEILSWDIPDSKKQKILDKLYVKYSEILKLESEHVSVLVAGPANYNSRRLDKSDKILEKSKYFYEWIEDLREQVKCSKDETKESKVKYIVERIERLIEMKLDPTKEITSLAHIDNNMFIKLYEKYSPNFKWRKNSTIYKLYCYSLQGQVKEFKKEIIYEDENLTAYIEQDRVYIRFIMRIQRPLIVALKSRGYWWNSHKKAWSTYPSRLDKEWIKSISSKYEKYL